MEIHGNRPWRFQFGLALALLSGTALVIPCLAAPAAVPRTAPTSTPLSSDLQNLVDAAQKAEAAGNLNLAFIQLKNAVRLAPQNGEVRARLGRLLLLTNQAVAAERELRQALADHAPAATTVPPLLEAMLKRNEDGQLLKEFPDPSNGALDPISPDVLKARAFALQRQGHSEESKIAIERSLMLRRDAAGLLAGAQLASLRGDGAVARNLADEAYKLAPSSEAALAASVEIGHEPKGNAKALATVDEFLRRVPTSLIAQVLRVNILIAMNEDAKAKEQIDAIAKQRRGLPYVAFFRGLLLARAKDSKGAWAIMQQLRPEFVQSNAQIAKNVAAVAAASGNSEAAGAILTTLIARNPDLRDAKLQLAAVRLSQKEPQAAIDILSTTKGDSDPVVQTILAQAYLQQGRYNDAINSLEVATAAPNSNDLLKRQLALSELQGGEPDQAVAGLRDLLARDPNNVGLNVALIAAQLKAGRSDEALAEANRLVKESPKSAIPFFYQGEVYIARNELTQAATSLDRAIGVDPRFLPARYYRASVSAARGDPESAKRDLEQLIKENPKVALPYVKLAQILADFGDDKAASDTLNRAVKAVPADPMPQLALAGLLLLEQKYQEAQTVVDTLLRTSPDNVDALALRGRLQLLQGNTVQALTTFRTITQSKPNLSGAYLLLASAMVDEKDLAGAEDAASKAVDLVPISPQVRETLINIQIARGKPDAALATARAYAKSYPGKEADMLVSDTLLRLKRTKDAQAVLETAMASRPDPQLVVSLARITMAMHRETEAKAILNNWLSKHPLDYLVKSARADLLMSTGDTAGARRDYEDLVKHNPDDPAVLNNLAWLIDKDDPKRALSLIAHAESIAPRSGAIADTLGWLRYQHGDLQGALPLIRRAHDLAPDNGAIGYHLAVALDSAGKRPEAKALLKTVLSKNSNFDGAVEAKKLLASW
jgi:putative PEP-CTERM system TPR-repeat lipoprotein